MKSIALLWNRGMRPLSIISCLVLEHKGKSRSSALTGNSDWTGSWGDLGGVWHLALPFDEYFRKFWYPHLQWFQRSTDNCGKIHVRIILGHPIVVICNGFHWPVSDHPQEAKVNNTSVSLKRLPRPPREAHVVKTADTTIQDVRPKPYEFII